MVIDVITFNGEFDLFDIRYNILKDCVDEFIVCEATKTFSGKDKPLYFEQVKDKYEKVRYFVIDDFNDNQLWAMAMSSPNTMGAWHWKREFYIKESIKKALTHLQDDDIVFIGDCDEIWSDKVLRYHLLELISPVKLKLKVYTYWLNNRSDERFWGTIVGYYGNFKNSCLNHIRSSGEEHCKTDGLSEFGWHFTSLKDDLKRKLEDSYTDQTYANKWVMENLEKNIEEGKDFLGRGFTYQVDESGWPQYLRDNKEKYLHLCKSLPS